MAPKSARPTPRSQLRGLLRAANLTYNGADTPAVLLQKLRAASVHVSADLARRVETQGTGEDAILQEETPVDMLPCKSARSAARVFIKAVHEEFVTATANGLKFFECSIKFNMFKELGPGDLLLLVQTRSQYRVVAVGEVAYPAVTRQCDRSVLHYCLPSSLRTSLDTYLDRGSSFDYVQFSHVYDLRRHYMNVVDVLAQGSFAEDPKKNLGMGVLATLSTATSSIQRLRDFLASHAVRRVLPITEGVDVW